MGIKFLYICVSLGFCLCIVVAFVVVVGPHYLVNVERFRAPVFVVVVA